MPQPPTQAQSLIKLTVFSLNPRIRSDQTKRQQQKKRRGRKPKKSVDGSQSDEPSQTGQSNETKKVTLRSVDEEATLISEHKRYR